MVSIRQVHELTLQVALRDELVAQLEHVRRDNARCIDNFSKVTCLYIKADRKLAKYRLKCAEWKARALWK